MSTLAHMARNRRPYGAAILSSGIIGLVLACTIGPPWSLPFSLACIAGTILMVVAEMATGGARG